MNSQLYERQLLTENTSTAILDSEVMQVTSHQIRMCFNQQSALQAQNKCFHVLGIVVYEWKWGILNIA